MNDLRILVVEDDEPQLDTWKIQISRFNARNEVNFRIDTATTLDEAEELIFSRKYDAAIIDIRLKRKGGPKDATHDGNEVRKRLLSSELSVVAHVTGEPNASDIDDDSSKVVKVFTKGGDEDHDEPIQYEILDWIKQQIPMILAIRQSKKLIKKQLAEVFCGSIWPRWTHWSEGSAAEFLGLSLARHLSSHLHNELLRDSDGKVHPEEWYFVPPNHSQFQTGDIVTDEDRQYILVSPRCDLERLGDKDTLLFAKMVDVSEQWSQDLGELNAKKESLGKVIDEACSAGDEAKVNKEKKKLDKIESEFRQKYSGHSRNKASLHFLPKIHVSETKGLGPFFVDFSYIIPVYNKSEKFIQLKSSRVASLSPAFVPSLVQRLGSYISRIGSPDYSNIH